MKPSNSRFATRNFNNLIGKHGAHNAGNKFRSGQIMLAHPTGRSEAIMSHLKIKK